VLGAVQLKNELFTIVKVKLGREIGSVEKMSPPPGESPKVELPKNARVSPAVDDTETAGRTADLGAAPFRI
jgi:hypothetical protein